MRLRREVTGRPGAAALKAAAKASVALAGLFLFILGLQMLKTGAGGVLPALQRLRLDGALNLFGLGWLMAYCVLSGSPIAAVSLGLFGSHAITDVESLGMVAGSRFGASFVVLLLGAVHYFRGRREMVTVATGVLCLLVTWSIYVPATIMGYVLLTTGLIDGARLPTPQALTSLVEFVYDPILVVMKQHLHLGALFALGVAALLGAFALFDRALPSIDPGHSRFRQIADVVYRPKVMFLLGIAVTCLTLSVSVSLGLLVPLSAKGYVRRENIIPYIMGANVSTFVDTLAASMLVGAPRAFTVVLAEMLGVGFFSLVILFGFYASYRDGLEWCLEWITLSRRTFLVFVASIMAVPLLLMVL